MKLLHIIDSLQTGGAERLITDSLPLYLEKGFDVHLALLDGKDYPFKEELLKKFPRNRIHNLSYGTVYNPFLTFKMMGLIKQFDIVHVHLFPAQYWVAIANMFNKNRIKLVFTEHSTGNRRMDNWMFKRIEMFIYSKYERITCITEAVYNNLKQKLKIPAAKLMVIQNGINLDLITLSNPYNRSLFVENNEKMILMVAKFRREKDHATVIRALDLLPSNYHVFFAGDGETEDECKKMVRSLNLESRVSFLGNRSDVYSLMKTADVFVISSHWEGFGLVAVEAMASGVPVIASNVAGLADVVRGAGMLFVPGDANCLASSICKLFNDVENYNIYQNHGRERSRRFSVESMVDSFINLYKTLN